MNRLITQTILIVCLALLVFSCSSKNKDQAKAQRPPVSVEVVTVTPADLEEGVDVTGSLVPKFEADVKSEYPGMIASVFVTEWLKVQKGTALARLDTRELDMASQRAQAALEAAKAGELETVVAQNRAHREYDRLVKLKEVGLVTQQSLDDGLTQKEAAEARVAAAKAQTRASQEELRQTQIRLSKAVIRSPMDGVVSQRNVNVGDLPGDKVLFKIVDNRLLNLTVTVPSSDMGSIKQGQPLTFSTVAIPGKTFTGRVMFINPAVSEADRSIKVIAEVKNDPEVLKSGLFAKGRISTGTRKGVLQVPRITLVTWDMAKRKGEVYVIEGDRAKRTAIDTGSVSGELVEITSGLNPGAQVVTRGAFNLKDDDRVQLKSAAGG